MHRLVVPLLAVFAAPALAAAAATVAAEAPPRPAAAAQQQPATAEPAMARGAETHAHPELAGLKPAALGVHAVAASAEAPLAVGVWPAQPYQGALLVVDVAAPAPIASATGTFLGTKLTWHRLADGTWRGMGPVPNRAPTGPAKLALQVKTEGNAKKIARTIDLDVQPLDFETDELTVDSKFTQISKKARTQIAKDRKLVSAMWKKGSAPEALFRGNFVLPRTDRTTAPYGTRRTYNGLTKSVHEGWDIDGNVGDEIRSPQAGVVTMASNLYYSGGTLYVDHGGGLYTAYFHMTDFAVKVGDRVEPGQLLGTVGKSGRVTGPHLHWAAKIGGHYIHPASLLLFDFTKPMVQKPAAPASEGPEVVPARATR